MRLRSLQMLFCQTDTMGSCKAALLRNLTTLRLTNADLSTAKDWHCQAGQDLQAQPAGPGRSSDREGQGVQSNLIAPLQMKNSLSTVNGTPFVEWCHYLNQNKQLARAMPQQVVVTLSPDTYVLCRHSC